MWMKNQCHVYCYAMTIHTQPPHNQTRQLTTNATSTFFHYSHPLSTPRQQIKQDWLIPRCQESSKIEQINDLQNPNGGNPIRSTVSKFKWKFGWSQNNLWWISFSWLPVQTEKTAKMLFRYSFRSVTVQRQTMFKPCLRTDSFGESCRGLGGVCWRF